MGRLEPMKETIAVMGWCVACLMAATSGQCSHFPAESTLTIHPSATVTIPYAELRALWNAEEAQAREIMQFKQARPPFDALILASDYKVDGHSIPAFLEASYHVRTLTDDWHLVPLLGGDVRLNQLELEQTSVVWHADQYCLLTRGKGDHHLNLRFALPDSSDWTTLRRLRLLPGRSALNRLRILGAPDGMAIRVPGFVAAPEADGSIIHHLPAELPELVLALETDAPSRPVAPSDWELSSEVLVGFKDGRLLYNVRAQAQASTGSGLSMELVLPANAIAAQASGEDLADHRVSPPQAGHRTLHLAWKTPDLLHRTFVLSYETPQSSRSTNWVLQAPQLAIAHETRALFVVRTIDGMGFTCPDPLGTNNALRLPHWIRDLVPSGDYYAIEGGPEINLQADWLPRFETAQAMVSRATFQSRVVDDGGLLVTAEFELQHESPLSWQVRLPTLDQLLTCQVNGHPVQPVHRDTHVLEFTLPAPAERTSRVTFSYAGRLPAMDRVLGSLHLDMPSTDLFIHKLDWLLILPDLYETTALEGNVRIARTPSNGGQHSPDSGHSLRLERELVQGETPRVDLHYQRRGLTDGN
jgi:hypothetical protein